MEKLNRLIMLVLFVHQFFCAQSLINGAPVENCRSMRPQHDFQHDSNKPVMPQMEPPPFIFTVSANNKSSINPEYNGWYLSPIFANQLLNIYLLIYIYVLFYVRMNLVTISSQNGETFKGYFIQARSLTDSREVAVIGTFELMKDDKFSKVISCPGGTKVNYKVLFSFY